MNEEQMEKFQKIFHIDEMRDLTPEESESYVKYLESIYESTGVNLLDLLDSEEDNENNIRG